MNRYQHRAALNHLAECERMFEISKQRFMATRHPFEQRRAEDVMDCWAGKVSSARQELHDVQEAWRANGGRN